MASIGHVAVGMAAGRHYGERTNARTRVAMLLLSGLSLAPDLDVIAFVFRIPYGAAWGHRGASHSLAMAALVGVIAAGVGAALRLPPVRTGITALLVTASHGLLDALTDGGLGAALLWPWDHTRCFAPWRPIPVAPIGLGFLSARGLSVALTELVMFLPLWVYALWPRRSR